MGHHPKANILAVRAALDRLTLARDGVDGKKIYLYGEGWNFGEVADDARFVQATQANMAGTGIGTFNDRLRDAVRGGGPFDENPRRPGLRLRPLHRPQRRPGQRHRGRAEGPAAALPGPDQGRPDRQPRRLPVHRPRPARRSPGAQIDYNGAPAGYTAAPGEAITYVDAHDNEILYDALAYKLPQRTSAADRARMQSVALATTALGQGAGFVTAGSERLRSKSLDRNSFNSGDWFNPIDWDCAAGQRLRPRPAAGRRQRGQVAVRQAAAGRPGADARLRRDQAWPTPVPGTAEDPPAPRRSSACRPPAEVQKRLSFPLSGAGGDARRDHHDAWTAAAWTGSGSR